MSYVIVTDSCANLTETLIDRYGIYVIPLSFHVKGEEFKSYVKGEVTDLKKFYDMMRNKEVITTSLIGPDQFTSFFSDILNEGHDILYISFSSVLSGTYQSAGIAAKDLAVTYPDRKILTIDSLSACMGQGLLVYHAANLKEEGQSIEEVYDWVLKNRLHLCHWFTCDDLFFLKRGGRISATTAILGSMLQVKPVMHMDDGGRLAVKEKARGRKQSLQALVNHMERSVVDPQKQLIFIAHGDCEEDAEFIKNLIVNKFTVKDVMIHYIDPVIGAHSGPGTVAVFYLGTDRNS